MTASDQVADKRLDPFDDSLETRRAEEIERVLVPGT